MNKNSIPKVTIAVPILNEAKFIGSALDSILNQSYKNIEVYIIDGGSTDGTIELIKNFPFNLEIVPKLGQMSSINRVWNSTDSKYVTWMAGDDILYSNAISDLVEVLEKNQDASFAHGPADVIDQQGNLLFHRRAKDIYTNDLLKSYCMLPQTGLIRRSALINSGLTNENLKFAADHELYLRLSLFGHGVAAKSTIAQFRIHSESEDAQNFAEVGRQTILVLDSILSSQTWSPFFSDIQVKMGRAHSRLVAGNFIITANHRNEALKLFLESIFIYWKVIFDKKFLTLLVRLITPFKIPPNTLRKLKIFSYQ